MLDEDQREYAKKLLVRPMLFPDAFKSWVTDFTAMQIPLIPFSHIFGARVNIARSGDFIEAAESYTGGGAYGDLATVGPQLLNIADGQYLIGYGCNSRGSMSPSINGVYPSDDDMVDANESGPAGARFLVRSFTNDNKNSVVMKYKENMAFKNRWLFVVRLGAPA